MNAPERLKWCPVHGALNQEGLNCRTFVENGSGTAGPNGHTCGRPLSVYVRRLTPITAGSLLSDREKP